MLAKLDTLYWAQPERLFNAQANEVTAGIGVLGTGLAPPPTFFISTPTKWAGRAVVDLNTGTPFPNHARFTLNFVNNAPTITTTPAGDQTSLGGPVTLALAANDADADPVTFSAVGGHLGYVVAQQLGLRLYVPPGGDPSQGTVYYNYFGQKEKWLYSTTGAWYYILPSGQLLKWTGDQRLASPTVGFQLDPIYYYHPELLYNPPAGDLAYALDQVLSLTAVNGHVNDLGLNEKWLQGNDGRYFITPSGFLYKWLPAPGSPSPINILMASLDPDYYVHIDRLANAQPNQVTVNVDRSTNMLTLTPATGFLGKFYVLIKANDGSQSAFSTLVLTVAS